MFHFLCDACRDLFAITANIFWIVMLVDACRRDFRDNTVRVGWILVVALCHVLGATIYFFFGRPTGTLRR
jgi:hypothetical protein